MPEKDNNLARTFTLPLSVAQPKDVGHLIREIGIINELLVQVALIEPKKKITINASVNLDAILKANGINLFDPKERTNLTSWLEHLRKSAPVINISFSTEASPEIIQKVTQWFRTEIDSYCLLVVGIAPYIGVGSLVRTNNKVFDLSLRNRLSAHHELLLSEIHRVTAGAAK